MLGLEIKQTLKELRKALKPEGKIESHIYSLQRAIEDLTISRDNWKNKADNYRKALDEAKEIALNSQGLFKAIKLTKKEK